MHNAVLVVNDLSVERSGRLAVENVSFALESESETALVAPMVLVKAHDRSLARSVQAFGQVEVLVVRWRPMASFQANTISDRLCA